MEQMEENVSGVATKLITLIRKALHEDAPVAEITDAEEAREIIEYASAQGLLMFLNEYESFREILRGRDYFKLNAADVYLRTHQTQELKKLLDAFEANQISCLVLKGVRSRELYPKPEWRSMGDIDLLYKPEQTKKVRRVMKNLGYEGEGSKVRHDEYNKGPVVVEMHKALCLPERKENKYFSKVWTRVAPRGEYKYVLNMSLEEHYLFTFTHLLEHFRTGGIGIRMVLDVYVLSQIDGLDWQYIDSVLCKLEYKSFHENIQKLAKGWFSQEKNGVVSAELKELETYILNGGIFGNWQNETMNRQLEYKGRLQYLKDIVFPNYETMKIVYSWLKSPFLLPIAWMARWSQAVLRRRGNIKTQMNRAQAFGVDEKELVERKRFFEDMGLLG